MALLKQEYDLSGAFFGFPGLSPVTFIEPQRRYLMSQFLTEADYAVRTADFVCMHTYWGGDGSTYLDSINQVRAFCQRYVNKLILVSEFANASQNVGKDVKGREYALYYTEAKKLPANLGGLFSYVMTSAGDYANQTWAGSSIPQTVGTRPVV